jgi:hypothetical protein
MKNACYTTAKVADNSLEYQTGGAFGSVLPKDFSFQPVAETIEGIYKTIDNAVSDNMLVEVKFNTIRHIPKYVGIKEADTQKEYTITVVDFNPVEKAKKPSATDDDFDKILTRLHREKAAWEAQNIRAYRFIVRTLTLTTPTSPIKVTVDVH